MEEKKRERNFCDYYIKPFPKKMESVKTPGLVVLMTGIHVMPWSSALGSGIGTVVAVTNLNFENTGSYYDDWTVVNFVDCKEEVPAVPESDSRIAAVELNQLKDTVSKEVFGISRTEALEKGLCLECKEPALPKCYSEDGKREYKISGLCEKCFDEITGGV